VNRVAIRRLMIGVLLMDLHKRFRFQPGHIEQEAERFELVPLADPHQLLDTFKNKSGCLLGPAASAISV
jgi:hypothetical protein